MIYIVVGAVRHWSGVINMVRYESDCVSCGLPCIGTACRHYRILVMECDKCHEEVDELYYGTNGKQLCADCALKELEKVEVE